MKPSELIADERHWCRRAGARDREHWPCSVDAPYAWSWCVSGALIRCALTYRSPEWVAFLGYTIERHGKATFHFNDDPRTTHGDVIAALRAVGL